jgi:transcriptional regulator with XRE-family HTH domain
VLFDLESSPDRFGIEKTTSTCSWEDYYNTGRASSLLGLEVWMGTPDQLNGDTFGKRIQDLRRERGLTQREVAARLDIDFTYLSKLENDRGESASEGTVRKLAAILDTDAEELLALAGRVPPELRERAQQDLEFATFLRRLPNASDKQLRSLYQQLKGKTPDQ